MDKNVDISLTINGEKVTGRVEARTNLVDFLRYDVGLTGSHVGCEHGVCGACTVRVDGRIVRGCLMAAAQADGADVWTIEGVTETGEIKPLQEAFVERNALQCGFCTPGFLTTAETVLAENPSPTRAEVQSAISGNICRCTGYVPIIDAILEAAERRRAGKK